MHEKPLKRTENTLFENNKPNLELVRMIFKPQYRDC